MKTTTYDVENYRVGEPGGIAGTVMKPHWKRCFSSSGQGAKKHAIDDANQFASEGGGRWRVVKRTVQREVIHQSK